jgi:hypothetical protein
MAKKAGGTLLRMLIHSKVPPAVLKLTFVTSLPDKHLMAQQAAKSAAC